MCETAREMIMSHAWNNVRYTRQQRRHGHALSTRAAQMSDRRAPPPNSRAHFGATSRDRARARIERNRYLCRPADRASIWRHRVIHQQIICLRDEGKAIFGIGRTRRDLLALRPHRGDVRRPDHGRTSAVRDKRAGAWSDDGRYHGYKRRRCPRRAPR
jgi:hypothetical protein